MSVLKAHVHQGHLVVDERSNLPEGAEVALVPASREELEAAERAAPPIEEGEESLERGDFAEGLELLSHLRERLTPR